MEMINQWFADHEDAVLVTDKIDDPEKMDSLFVDKERLYMELFVKSAEEIKSIFVYNISGTLIANDSDINSLECQTLIGDNDGLLIVKIQTTDSIEVLKIF
jgi:hypothetical protein